MKLIKVLIELPTNSLDTLYTYYCEDKVDICPFVRVKVSFGRMQLVAFVMEVEETNLTLQQYQEQAKFKIKPIISIIDDVPLLSKELVDLGQTLKEALYVPLISCYQAFLPPALKVSKSSKPKIKYQISLSASSGKFVLTKTQQECYQFVKDNNLVPREEVPFSPAIIRALVTKKALEIVKKEKYRYSHHIKEDAPSFSLSLQQQKAVKTIINNDGPFLLFGVTGSGKTAVYIDVVNKTLAKGKGAIILVPEISLTPQLIKVYRNSLNDDIAVLHSALSDGERYDEYRRIKEEKAKIVIGTRSAIFAPIKKIGVIILDEEHSSSYKQTTSPRYHAREVAIMRSKFHHAKVVLGSATPSIETFAYASAGRYQLVELPERINNNPFPDTRIIDMSEEAKQGNFKIISRQLDDAIKEKLSKNEQIILLLNRRGYASSANCGLCGYNFVCPNCKIALVYHREEDIISCHNCGYSEDKPNRCPVCRSNQIRFYGIGTQKLEELLRQSYPEAKTLRFDTDTANYKGAHEDIVTMFEEKKADILFGTQMVAKGFNFENVTLIGVINAEQTLNRPNFRAAEETFQLLTQVIGRAGRFSKKGLALIQTYRPTHYAIVLSTTQDYTRFFNKEIQVRKLRSYPPFYKLLHIVFLGNKSDLLFALAHKIKADLQLKDVLVSGPAYPYIKEKDDLLQVRLVVRYKNILSINDYLKKLKSDKDIKIYINIDPYEEV